MIFVTYYPDQRHQLAMTNIRRERVLPPEAIGELETHEGERVDLRDIIARGSMPSRFVLLDAMSTLALKKPEDLMSLMQVQEGESVEARQVLAGKDPKRGRRLFAPVAGTVYYIGEGRIILQELAETVEVEARLIGTVVGVVPDRGVVIESVGSVVQGVWGNGQVRVGVVRLEPNQGFESLDPDQLDVQYGGSIVVTRRPLTEAGIRSISTLGLAGLIAPTMDIRLIPDVQNLTAAVMLTDMFGTARMNAFVYNFLEGLNGKQATIDATQPSRFESRRPEVIVNVPARSGSRPPMPDPDMTLAQGMTVRLTHGHTVGQVGQVIHLPKTPYLLDNGLRVPCAEVQLSTGDSVFVPLANLEVFGQ